MSADGLELKVDACTEEDIHSHLSACDREFRPPLSDRVDVGEYSRKLRQSARTFEAWRKGTLVGLVAAYFDAGKRSCFVTSTSVLPEFSGRGIATRVLAACLAAARAARAETASLEVSKDSHAAIRLYAKLGFRVVEEKGRVLLMRREGLQDASPVAGDGTTRDHNNEYQDNDSRRYAYDFDTVVRRYMMRALSPFFGDGKALELGCFEGETTKMYADRFRDLTVVEAADSLIAVARSRVPARVRFVHSTIEAAELGPHFDSVFLVHTLEHLDHPVEALSRIRGWLGPGGRLFVVVPNADAASRQIAVAMGLIETGTAVTPGERSHGHRRTYDMNALERDAQQAGLRIESKGGILFKPFANFQFDLLMKHKVIDEAYLDGCYDLGLRYPELTASIYLVCQRS